MIVRTKGADMTEAEAWAELARWNDNPGSQLDTQALAVVLAARTQPA
jgi:hypothetical protein